MNGDYRCEDEVTAADVRSGEYEVWRRDIDGRMWFRRKGQGPILGVPAEPKTAADLLDAGEDLLDDDDDGDLDEGDDDAV